MKQNRNSKGQFIRPITQYTVMIFKNIVYISGTPLIAGTGYVIYHSPHILKDVWKIDHNGNELPDAMHYRFEVADDGVLGVYPIRVQ